MQIKAEGMKLNKIFLFSALFFAFFSFFGVYEYKIYNLTWFILFFMYELLFFLGLSSGNIRIRGFSCRPKSHSGFYLSKIGSQILWFFCILSVLSFLYFIYNYRIILGRFVFGRYTADAFAEGRSSLEKITLLIMQIGGDSAFLILFSDDSSKYKKLKKLSYITLFLPGIRYLLMGLRFTIATEFLVFFAVKWPYLKKKINFSKKAKREKQIIVIGAIILGIAFMYLFASRSIYYTALERKAFNVGDMVMKPLWRSIYNIANGKIDFICTASDYLGESPYVFSYQSMYSFPNKIYWGQFTFRSIMQIVNNVFHVGKGYSEIVLEIASGQYSGFAYVLIADFGLIGSFFAAYLIGRLFAFIEKKRFSYSACSAIYPAIKVICFFAPVFYFYVGRIDYAILFAVILAPICLKKRRISLNEKTVLSCE